MKKRYGDVSTHLTLRGKALEYYNSVVPISIFEYETDDGYRYDLNDAGFKFDGFEEKELVEYFECMYDALYCDEEGDE